MPSLSGELDRLVREPERLLAEPDRPSLAGHRVELCRWRPGRTRGDAAQRQQPGATPSPGRELRTLGRVPAPPDRGGPLAEVPGRDRPHHRRELVAVPRRLPAQDAERHEEQEPEEAQPPGRLGVDGAVRRRLARFEGSLRLGRLVRGARRGRRPDAAGASAAAGAATTQARGSGSSGRRGPSSRRGAGAAGWPSRPARMKSGIGVSSAIVLGRRSGCASSARAASG